MDTDPDYPVLSAAMRGMAEKIGEHLTTEYACEVGPLTEFSMPSYGRLYVTNEGAIRTYFIITPSKWPPKSIMVIIVDGKVDTLPPNGVGHVIKMPIKVHAELVTEH